MGKLQYGQLTIGDKVLGINEAIEVTGVYDRGELPVYEVIFDDKTSTMCSNDHLWAVCDKLNSEDYHTVDLNYIMRNFSQQSFYIPMIQKADFRKQNLPIDPYILGVLLGDGSISCAGVSFTINDRDKDIVNRVCERLPQGYKCFEKKGNPHNHSKSFQIGSSTYKKTFKGIYEYFIDNRLIGDWEQLYEYIQVNYGLNCSKSSFKVRLSSAYTGGRHLTGVHKFLRHTLKVTRKTRDNLKSNIILSELLHLGVYGKKSKNKFIPDIYKYSSFQDRIELLRGLIDTDGYVDKHGGIFFYSTSYQLLMDVKELCESLGCKVRVGNDRKPVKAFGNEYIYGYPIGIKIICPDGLICCYTPYKKNRLNIKRSSDSYYRVKRKIKKINYIGLKKCRCIKVSAENGLYITNNFIVTHNTLQAISLARYKKEHRNLKHCLIVCGVNSLKWNWEREISKFCKDERGIVLGTRINKKGKPTSITVEQTEEQIRQCPEEFFWIINIERMRASKKDLEAGNTIIDELNVHIKNKELGMLIFDECHKAKNLDSAQAQGIMALDKNISKMLMTGTLLVNNPYDLYCPMSICGLINYNKFLFERKFVIKNEWKQVVGYQNMEELHNILYKSSIRRTKDLLDLPDKIYKQEWLEFNKDEQNVFEQLCGNIPFNLDKIEQPGELMAVLTRIRQCTVASELLTTKKIKSTKFERLNDILEEAKMNNQKVLVFCPFTEALKLGMEYCKEYNPKLVIGGMGSKLQEEVDKHENTEGFSVLFAQEATLGVGFTLTNTSIVVFLSPPWSKATYDQCIDRTHRIGQKSTVQVIDLLIKDTYDECIYKKLHGKGAMSSIIIDGDETEQAKRYIQDMGITFMKKSESEELSKPDIRTLLDGGV